MTDDVRDTESGVSDSAQVLPEQGPSSETPAAGRDAATGRFTEGNQAARRHGLKAFARHGEASMPPELRQHLDDFRTGLANDQGGPESLSTVAAGYVSRLVEVEAVACLLGEDLQRRGLFTTRGRVRSTFTAYLAALDRWDRLAQRLGMTRKARDLSMSDFVNAAAQQPDGGNDAA